MHFFFTSHPLIQHEREKVKRFSINNLSVFSQLYLYNTAQHAFSIAKPNLYSPPLRWGAKRFQASITPFDICVAVPLDAHVITR